MHAYLAGPMRGRPAFNFPVFDAAAELLRRQGHTVFNPADADRAGGFDPTGLTGYEDLDGLGFDLIEAVHRDLYTILVDIDAVVLLPNWHLSTGAKLEAAVAQAVGVALYELRPDGTLRHIRWECTIVPGLVTCEH